MLYRSALAVLLLALMAAGGTVAQTYTGSLASGDDTLDNGEYYDVYTIEVQAGQRLVGTLRSSSFDTYLIFRDPSGEFTQNDDWDGATNVSRIEMDVAEGGTWRVIVTSLEKGETGKYELVIEMSGGSSGGGGGIVYDERGSLAGGDETLDSGEYADVHTVNVRAGQDISVILTSDDFDTFLGVRPAGGELVQNDDWEGSSNMSRIDFPNAPAGQLQIVVTSYKAGEKGSYRIQVMTEGGGSSPAGTSAYDERGALAGGDETLDSGEYADVHTVNVRAGQDISVILTSDDFDTFLGVRPAGGELVQNDDWEGSSNMSRIDLPNVAGGQLQIVVTSFKAGEKGNYRIQVLTSGKGGTKGRSGPRIERGKLENGDTTLNSGEYVDHYTFAGTAGEQVVVDLRSTEFDPYLIVKTPGGEQFDNDDHEGSGERSQLVLTLEETGEFRVLVTSYKAGESGAYALTITQASSGSDTDGPVAARTERGSLGSGDKTLRSGEYVDSYRLEAAPGQRIVLDVSSSEFDTYLLLKTPSGEQLENDDAEGLSGHSVIEHVATEVGTYTVLVTSYQAGETGRYDLTINTTADQRQASSTRSRQQDVNALTIGERVRGALESGDRTLSSGEYLDTHVFEGRAGQYVIVEMESGDFDTYLGMTTPGGETIENDDWEGSSSRSRIEMELPADGRYRITTTSYAAEETGGYLLAVSEGTAAQAAAARTADSRPAGSDGANVYGIFVGLSDYGGRASNLRYTDEDPVVVRDALIRNGSLRMEHAITLVDAQATTANFRQGIRDLAARMDDDDLFVLFFSGHGGRYPRADGFQSTDPDGVDESLEFYDAEILDDELSTLLDVVPGTQMLIVDACFSGGLGKDVISKPGRMGLFSSEEDVTSNVAAKFEAGGYLSKFFADAVADGLSDDDGDGQITAIELSQYLYERYRGEVKAGGVQDVVITTARQLGYQKLVVDRGSVRPYSPLFRVR